MIRKLFGQGRGDADRDILMIETGVGIMPNNQTSAPLPHKLGVKPHGVIINSGYESENYRMKANFTDWTDSQIVVSRSMATSTGDVNFNYTIIGIKPSKVPR